MLFEFLVMGFGKFFIFEVEELIGWYIDWKVIVFIGFEYGWEDDVVEYNIVFVDEVD